MTREEALQILDTIPTIGEQVDALELAIEALSTEPCEDCISRTQAIKAMDELENEDIEAYGCSIPEGFDGERARQAICLLPSVQPKPKTGHWIEKDGFDGDTYYDCSECGESWTTIEGTPWNNGMKYCPNCGAKMETLNES